MFNFFKSLNNFFEFSHKIRIIISYILMIIVKLITFLNIALLIPIINYYHAENQKTQDLFFLEYFSNSSLKEILIYIGILIIVKELISIAAQYIILLNKKMI